ncbi:phage holin family protein [Tenacibaculum sp. MAR_2009_124]|uniref:phage holin family protein n=1 Tax=Tenacibaculum sp. MAR_2009_124 TaxID=1250059 RepID=UPI0015A336D1|nr:phage holin family protein [Tenacibaculum sp. MAR_2009_124]
MKLKLFIALSVAGGVFSDIISLFIKEKNQFLAIFAVVAIDVIFGVIRSIKKGNFQTRKSFKGLSRFVAFCWLLATVLLIEDAYSFASFLSEAILLPILIFQLISVLKNMSLLGLISNETLLKILNKIDTHKHDESNSENFDDLNSLSHE